MLFIILLNLGDNDKLTSNKNYNNCAKKYNKFYIIK